MSDPAAVQSDNLAGKIRIFIPQMIYQVRHLFRLPQAAGRDFIYQSNEVFFRHPLVHFRVNRSAGYSVDLNIGGGKFFCQRLGEGIDPPLVAE